MRLAGSDMEAGSDTEAKAAVGTGPGAVPDIDSTPSVDLTAESAAAGDAPIPPSIQVSRSALPVALTQLIAYLLLVVLVLATSLLLGRVANISQLLGQTASVVMILLFVVYWPMGGKISERVVGPVVGYAGLFLEIVLAKANRSSGAEGWYIGWAQAFVVLLVVAIIAAFLQQMLRKDRSGLVLSLSRTLMAAVACICATGWSLLGSLVVPWPVVMVTNGPVGRIMIISLAVGILVELLLLLASCRWWRQAEDSVVQTPWSWLGMGLLPVMLAGVLPPAAGLLPTLLV
ncbi:hypothetical protein CRD60_05475 [Bifidobacterium aemilianum]|uniref:Uncharacterized protein n=1 Tax=Bifidobacterium aemilianum TaxID=2493120 RepID=A0A366K7G7_9BIFI|nr:hypothetical protein [Bifidobacterium aemilianum]RBP97685.1 hypothetical protein CRD60_05475 [Bifidobacterium aemilianum]